MSVVTDTYLLRSEQAQKDLMLILEYLAERTKRSGKADVADEDVQRAAQLCATPFGSLKEQQRGEIWVLMNRFSALIAPATVEGLRRARSPDVSRWSGFRALIFGVCLLLPATLMVQAYTILGTRTLDRLNEKTAELNETYDLINALKEHRPELVNVSISLGLTKYYSEKTGSWADLDAAALKHQHLKLRIEAIRRSIETLYKDMYSWNAVWAAPFTHSLGQEPGEFWGFDCQPSEEDPCLAWLTHRTNKLKGYNNGYAIEAPDENTSEGDIQEIAANSKLPKSNSVDHEIWAAAPRGHIQIKYGSEVFAQSNLEMLRGVWLPVLYGALGSCVWLLRERYRQLRVLRWRSPGGGEYMQRVFLGAVLGAALGYLNVSSFLPDTAANISLTGLAFIIGYNVDAIFRRFDNMITTNRGQQAEEDKV